MTNISDIFLSEPIEHANQCTMPNQNTIPLPSIHQILGSNKDRLDGCVEWGDGDLWGWEDQINMKAKITLIDYVHDNRS